MPESFYNWIAETARKYSELLSFAVNYRKTVLETLPAVKSEDSRQRLERELSRANNMVKSTGESRRFYLDALEKEAEKQMPPATATIEAQLVGCT
jgi:hypothetical protein